nr:MAG TPA: hypothetical protein [Bacteriophage sp.]
MEKNNFNPIGNRPLAPTIYDENITPLESMNKLAFKINQLIGDDTNVKEVVDKLLDVYASHMKLQGGYCEELKCIAFENPIRCNLIKPESPIYTPVKNIEVGVNNVKGDVTFYQWQYKNDGLFVDLEADGSNTAKCKVPVTFYNSGDKKEFRCKLQNDKYTYYTEAIVIEYLIPTGVITQTKNGNVDTYEQNQLSFKSDFPTDNDNIGWMWSNDNNNWNEYGRKDISIKPYYYIDKGTKTNGVSVKDSDKIYWKYQFKVNGKEYFSNTLVTNVTKVDFDCGSATFNGVANNNWDNVTNMIQWYSYYEMHKTNKLVDLALSINKSLNNSVITSMQWLKASAFNNFDSKPVPKGLLTGATDKDENITINIESGTYLTYYTLAFRLQVVVGNIAYYSDIVCVYAPFAIINIEKTPYTAVNIGATVKLTASFNEHVPNSYNINDVTWFVSNDGTSWTKYTVYDASHNIITIKIYDDNASHSDGYGVNGGNRLYVACIIGDKINNTTTIAINRS